VVLLTRRRHHHLHHLRQYLHLHLLLHLLKFQNHLLMNVVVKIIIGARLLLQQNQTKMTIMTSPAFVRRRHRRRRPYRYQLSKIRHWQRTMTTMK
jgi:hypothetical protein